MATYDSYKDSGVKWLGQIPSHWEVKKLRSFLQLFSERNHGDKQLLSVTRDRGVIVRGAKGDDDNHNVIPEDLSGYKHVLPGDFVINKMKSWQGSYGVSDYEGIVSPAYFTYHLNITNRKFFSLALRSIAYIPFFMQYSKGIRVDQWDLTPDALKAIPFFLPPLNEQEAIVSYLDKVTADIDKAIEAQQKMIEALNERKQIIITRAVTRGLNPDAPLKDSGIDWLGQIPEHWDLVRTSLVFPYIGSGTTPSSSNQNYYADFGTPWLQTGDLNDNELTTSSRFITELALKDCNLRVYPSGSVVIAMYGATIGKTALLRFATTVNQACCVLPISSKCLSKFALYYFQGTKQALIQEANGGGQPNINQQLVRRHKLLLPSLNEQAEIISFIENSLIPINNAKLVCEQTISLLQERKQIIINEVVTGKKKVI